MKWALCILSACLVWLFVEVSISESQSISTLQAVERFAETLNKGAGAFTLIVESVTSTTSPYLGVLSAVIELMAANKAASNQSAELNNLRELSEKINQKLDDVISQFSELKNLIRWTAIQSTYATYETNIRSVSRHFRQIFEGPLSKMNNTKELFINSYNSDYHDSGSKLFQGFVIDHGVFSQGFLRPAMNYTENNRGQMRTFMLGTLKLLLMAANLELGYMTIRGYDDQIPFYRHQWQLRFEQVQERMKAIDLELKNHYLVQSKIDIDTFSGKNFAMSNPMFGRSLYKELSTKYFWREWLVVVSMHTDYNHDAYSRVCNGVVKSTHGAKDLVIDSFEKNTTNSDFQNVMKQRCASLQQSCQNTVQYNPCNDDPTATHRRSRRCGTYYSENADVVFNWITNVGSSCSPVSSYGVIDTHKNPVYYAGPTDNSPDRLFVCDLGVCNYYVHFFG